jgi:hypothetical protein
MEDRRTEFPALSGCWASTAEVIERLYCLQEAWGSTLKRTSVRCSVRSTPEDQCVCKSEVVPVYAVKAYRGSGCGAPLILNFGEGWRWVVNSALPSGENPDTHWLGGWVGPGAGLDIFEKRKISCPSRDSNHELPTSYLNICIPHQIPWIGAFWYSCFGNGVLKKVFHLKGRKKGVLHQISVGSWENLLGGFAVAWWYCVIMWCILE